MDFQILIICFIGLIQLTCAVDSKLDFTEVARVVEQKGSNEVIMLPNVRGVRVTVDTTLKGSPESKSSDESGSDSSYSGDQNSSGSSVGVKTDITVQLSNETKSQEDDKIKDKKKDNKHQSDDDNDIPILKGRTVPSHDGKGDVTTWRPLVRPLFAKHDSEERFKTVQDTPWNKAFPNSGFWTTERSNHGTYDNSLSHTQQYMGTGWHPCRCDLTRPWPSVSIDLNDEPNIGSNVYNRKPHYHHTHIADKLDEPFSSDRHTKNQSKRRRRRNATK